MFIQYVYILYTIYYIPTSLTTLTTTNTTTTTIQIRYYQQQRQNSSNNHNPGSTRVTVRLLESLLRLSQAHAKLMCKRIVSLEDAVVAIWVISLSQQQLSNSNSTSTSMSVLHSNFPLDPDGFYRESVEIPILASLNCTRQGCGVSECIGVL